MSAPARLVISDTILFEHEQRGVARYFDVILEAIVTEFGGQVVCCSPHHRVRRPAQHIPVPRLPRRVRLNKLLQDGIASLTATAVRAKVVYSPYYGNAVTKAGEVFTVYDMIDELRLNYADPPSPAGRHFLEEKRRCLERATLLFAISETTANDVTRCYPKVDPRKIIVTPLGVEANFLTGRAAPPMPEAGRPYFLYVGHRNRYKNFMRLLEAYAHSGLSADYNLRVVSPVAQPWTEAEGTLIRQSGLEQRVNCIVSPSDQELRALYAAAHAFVYPSEYEGFGLPILEAMASGTLVLASRAGPIPEVGGEAAVYFDPLDTESITHCLRLSVELSEAERGRRLDSGHARARQFTWARCQQQTVHALRPLLASA
jgi:glycosyltransferase involved in cell wall biosynthesis